MDTGVSMQLSLRPIEAKLLALALDAAARGNEIETSAIKLISLLRTRGVSAAQIFQRHHAPKTSATNVDGKTLSRALATRMPFGKHKHKQLCNVPVDYLVWARINCRNMSVGLREAISVVLEERRS